MDPHSSIARAEAQRWIGIAEKLLISNDLVGSKTFAIRARESDPRLESADQILAIVDTLLAAEKRVLGPNGIHQPDFYAILQLVRFAHDSDHIAASYRRLAVVLNPHNNRFPYSDQAFQLVNDAWSVLSNPMRKSLYDADLDFPQNQQQMNNLGFDIEQHHHHDHQQPPHQHQHNFFSITREPQQTFQPRVQLGHQQELQQHNFLSENAFRSIAVSSQEQLFHQQQQVQPFQVTEEQRKQQQQLQQLEEQRKQQQLKQLEEQRKQQQLQQEEQRKQQQLKQLEEQRKQQQLQQEEQRKQQQLKQLEEQRKQQQLQEEQRKQQQLLEEQRKQQHLLEEQRKQQHLQQLEEQRRQHQLQFEEEQRKQQQLQQLEEQRKQQHLKQLEEQRKQQQLKQLEEQRKQQQLQEEQRKQQQLQEEQRKQQELQEEQRKHQQLQEEQQKQQQLQQEQQKQQESSRQNAAPVQLPSQDNTNNGVREEETEPEAEAEAEAVDDSPTFWTACPYCFYMYEYPKVYVECTLRCDNCKRAFQAVRIASPPPIIEGQDAYFYCWGFFPLGLSMPNLQNNNKGRNSNWTPFSSLHNAPNNAQNHLNEQAAPKENLFVN